MRTGAALMTAGEYSLAIRSFNRSITEQGPSVAAFVGLGAAHERLGRLGLAERYLRAAVEADPAEVVAWNNLGVVLQSKDDYVGAATAFQMAFALDSGETDIIRDNLNAARLKAQELDRSHGTDGTKFLVPMGHGRYVLERDTVE